MSVLLSNLLPFGRTRNIPQRGLSTPIPVLQSKRGIRRSRKRRRRQGGQQELALYPCFSPSHSDFRHCLLLGSSRKMIPQQGSTLPFLGSVQPIWNKSSPFPSGFHQVGDDIYGADVPCGGARASLMCLGTAQPRDAAFRGCNSPNPLLCLRDRLAEIISRLFALQPPALLKSVFKSRGSPAPRGGTELAHTLLLQL